MKIELKPLSLDDINDKVYQMFQDIPAEENGANNPAHGLSREAFAKWVREEINHSEGKDLKPGYVPGTTYILWIDNQPVGRGNLRHYLVPSLERDGGHIGIHLSPKYRGKGYGNVLLAEMLKEAKKMGISKALVFNHDNNTAAWKMSERAGGILENIRDIPEKGIKLRKYQIDLSR